MLYFDYDPEVIEAQRRDLRRAFNPLPRELKRHATRRQAMGRYLVRFGHWIEGRRPELIGEHSASLINSAERV